jgi:3-deoxy-D-manno-octulosonic-acid transferase
MHMLYQLGVNVYFLLIRLSAPFNSKARQWVHGRKNCWPLLEKQAAKGKHWLWFHAASLGEFEQGRPLIEALKKNHPEFKILLTFFSPSGYEMRKDYPLADCVSYLPADSPTNAIRLLNTFNPKAVFFIKYEFWYNYLQKIQIKQIPLFYISLKLRPDQYFFKAYGAWFRKQLHAVTHFFVQDKQTASLLNDHGFLNVSITGDTRFDRVAAIAEKSEKFPGIEQFIANKNLIILGSTWPKDEKLLIPILRKLPIQHKIIIAPHDVGQAHIKQLSRELGNDFQLWSSFNPEKEARYLIIDSIGILSQIYQYARFAYIGGGFGTAIHNIQEAVTFGCPVVFGPNHHKFTEAVELIKLGGAFEVTNSAQAEAIINQLVSDEAFLLKSSRICKDYVQSQIGATNLIIKHILPYLKYI